MGGLAVAGIFGLNQLVPSITNLMETESMKNITSNSSFMTGSLMLPMLLMMLFSRSSNRDDDDVNIVLVDREDDNG
jgi:hypothetical protein